MKKAELRKLYLQKMTGLSKEDHALKSKNICEVFLSSFNLGQYKSLHIFLPIIRNNEVNTRCIIQEVKRLHPEISIIIPKSDFKTLDMSAHILGEETELVESPSGILEPSTLKFFNEEEIDIVILPLLAFDKKGFRVGYGKGFYDRFLKKCRKDVEKIGVSFFDPVEIIEDVNENDVPMEYCITPEKLFAFN
ncbi:MAG TPA: 5-formyltetrahydrofolate cyclo-ligase [Cytophagales bacterium]|nr:5-formyltetrahydrofolate cyclo-ligase [Cytophagales bacterium]